MYILLYLCNNNIHNMATLRELASNIHLQLKQLNDDSDIRFSQVVFWVSFFINKYRFTKIPTTDSGRYLSIFDNVPVSMFLTSNPPHEVAGRKFFTLPENIYDFKDDRSIQYITYSQFDDECFPNFTGVTFSRTTPSKSRRLFYSPYEIPTPKNPYWYRVGNNIYLLGLECININSVEIGIITAFNPFNCNLDEEIGDVEIYDYITRNCLDLGRFTMLVPNDQINDANSTNSPTNTPTQKIVSVNSQPQQQVTE